MSEVTREWIDDQLQKIKAYPRWGDMAPFADKLFEAALNEAKTRGLTQVNCGIGNGGALMILALARYVAGQEFSILGYDFGLIPMRRANVDISQSEVDCCLKRDMRYINRDSVSAAEEFEAGTVGILVLDTKPTLQRVSAELVAWAPKMATGGQIWVHDYTNLVAGMGVKTAVDQFIAEHPEYSLEVLPEPPGFAILKKGEKDGSQQGDVLQRDGNGGAVGSEGLHDLSSDQGAGVYAMEGNGIMENQPLCGEGLPGDQSQGPGDPEPTAADNRYP